MRTTTLTLMLTISIAIAAQSPTLLTDFEQWNVRNIKESALLGGQVKPYYTIKGARWSTSNTYARVMGIDKVSSSVWPETRGTGHCCRLECTMDTVKAVGISLKVLVAGSIYTGRAIEPKNIKSAERPMALLDMGVPFTGRPKALVLDYKAHIEPSNELYRANASTRVERLEGRDGAEIIVLLQRRWEDAKGNIHAERVGTGWFRIMKSTSWLDDFEIPIRWGDITKMVGFKDYEGLQTDNFMASNSHGKMVPIQEVGYSNLDPTHIIIMISSGCHEAFCGHAGNVLWVDNVRLKY